MTQRDSSPGSRLALSLTIQAGVPLLLMRRALIDGIVVPMHCPPMALPILQSAAAILPAAAQSEPGFAPALGTVCLQLLQRYGRADLPCARVLRGMHA